MAIYICILALILAILLGACVMEALVGHIYLNGYNQWLDVILIGLIAIDIVGLKAEDPFRASVFVGIFVILSLGNIWDVKDKIHFKRLRFEHQQEMLIAKKYGIVARVDHESDHD